MTNEALAAALGNRIRQLRTARGWSQREFAHQVGVVNASMISYYELGERMPSYGTLLRIADVFHISTDYLLRGVNSKQLNIDGLDDDAASAVMVIVDRMIHGTKTKEQAP